MTTWKLTTAAALATLVFAGSALAQGTTGSAASGTDKAKSEQPKSSSDTMKSSDTAKSSDMKSADKSADGMKSQGRKGGAAMGDEKVKAAQQALKDKGHDPGDVDGKMGPKTQAALRDFQKAQGIQATGRLDAKTAQALGMEGARTSGASDTSTTGSASPSTGASSGATSAPSASPGAGSDTKAPADAKPSGDAAAPKSDEKK